MKNNQKGFSVVAVLLALVIVGMISGTGWYVWHAKQATDQSLSQAGNSTTGPVNGKKQSQSADMKRMSNTATAMKYLTIREWGIRAPYGGTDTLSYTMTDGGLLVEVVSKHLADMYGCKTFGAGLISRQNPTDPAGPAGADQETVAQVARANPDQYKLIDGYYYTYARDQSSCGSITVDRGESDQQHASDFTGSLISKLEKTPS